MSKTNDEINRILLEQSTNSSRSTKDSKKSSVIKDEPDSIEDILSQEVSDRSSNTAKPRGVDEPSKETLEELLNDSRSSEIKTASHTTQKKRHYDKSLDSIENIIGESVHSQKTINKHKPTVEYENVTQIFWNMFYACLFYHLRFRLT